jgi:transglutaminase-like putative cysteine protease
MVTAQRAEAPAPSPPVPPDGDPVVVRRRWGPTGLAVLGLLLATGAAGLVSSRIFAGMQLPVLLCGSAVGAVTFTVLLRLGRAPGVLAVVGSLVGLVACLIGATAALRDPAAGGSLLSVLADALRNSGARILTSAIPVGPAPDTVSLPMAASWLAGSIGVVLLGPLRGPAARTGRRGAAAAVPPLVLLVAALVFVGPNGAPSYPFVTAFVLGEALLLVAAQLSQAPVAVDGGSAEPGAAGARRLAALRRTAAAVVVLAVLGAVAVTAGPALAGLVGRQPTDPRSYVQPPNQRVNQLNPLGLLAAWAIDPTTPLLSVRTDTPERIRWATLSGFDGLSWQPDANYRSAGSVLPGPAGRTGPTSTVRQDITVRQLGGNFLPAVADVRQVNGVRVGYDGRSGAVLAPDGLAAGVTYQTVSAVPRQDPDRLVGAPVPTGGDYAGYLTVPAGLPAGIAVLARDTASAGTPYQRALLLEKLLATRFQYWSKAPSGNGYVTLTNFLVTEPAKGGGRGTSEQFASAFAVMARVVGLPSRVVVGFHAGTRKGGVYQVASGDAFAWPEIYFSGYGWVAFDPTPKAGKGGTPPEDDTPQAKTQQQQKSQQLDSASPTPTPSHPSPGASAPVGGAHRPGAAVPPGLLGGGAGAVVLVLLVAAIPLLRRRRTARRLDRGSPAERVVGAWTEVREALRLAGEPPGESLSAAEVAALAATAGPPPKHPAPPLPELGPLAAAVNAVAFAGPAPVAATDARQAANLARAYHRSLRSRFAPLRRLWWRLDPRPLFWRHR